MKAVGIGEIVAALQGAAHGIPIDAVKRSEYLLRLADTIEAHGIAYEPKGEEAIAPSDGWVLVAEVVRNDTGQIRVVGAKGDSFDMSKFIGVKLYAATSEVSE